MGPPYHVQRLTEDDDHQRLEFCREEPSRRWTPEAAGKPLSIRRWEIRFSGRTWAGFGRGRASGQHGYCGDCGVSAGSDGLGLHPAAA
jgi:hypothetical protein